MMTSLTKNRNGSMDLSNLDYLVTGLQEFKNSIRDVHTPQPGEIVFFNTMRYRSSETVQRSGYFQSSVSYIKVKMMIK